MPAAKLIVMYPTPRDVATFDRVYNEEHLPLAAPIFKAAKATKIVLTQIAGAAAGSPPFHRVAEIHFASMDDLKACAASADGQKAVKHAHEISNGGPPTILIATEDVVTF